MWTQEEKLIKTKQCNKNKKNEKVVIDFAQLQTLNAIRANDMRRYACWYSSGTLVMRAPSYLLMVPFDGTHA